MTLNPTRLLSYLIIKTVVITVLSYTVSCVSHSYFLISTDLKILFFSISHFRYTKIKQQYDLKQQEVEHLKEKLEAGSHHQQLEEINSLRQNIGLCRVFLEP